VEITSATRSKIEIWLRRHDNVEGHSTTYWASQAMVYFGFHHTFYAEVYNIVRDILRDK